MSSDLKKAKRNIASIYPEKVIDSVGPIDRYEPLLTPSELKSRYFFGVPLTSPVTGEKVSKKMFDDMIKRAVNLFELEAQLDVMPTIRRHRLPFDPNLYHNNVHLEIPNKPIRKVIRLSVAAANYNEMITTPDQPGTQGYPVGTPQEMLRYPSPGGLYTYPNEWIEMGYAYKGSLSINPMSPAFSAIGGTSNPTAVSGSVLSYFLSQLNFMPAYWLIECLHGIMCEDDGTVPVIVNEAIGQRATMLLIDNILPLFRITSQSMGADSLNQSIGDNMLNLLQGKRDTAEKEYQKILKRLKIIYNLRFIASNV